MNMTQNNIVNETVVMEMSQRTGSNRRLWLIEGAYFLQSQKRRDHFQIDFCKLRNLLELRGSFYAANYFCSEPPYMPVGQRNFFSYLSMKSPMGPNFNVRPYMLKQLHCACPNCNHEFGRHVTGGVDAGITTAALIEANNYDTLVLSSGDGDYVDAIKHIHNTLGKRVELVGFDGTISHRLKNLCDETILLDDYMPQITRETFRKVA